MKKITTLIVFALAISGVRAQYTTIATDAANDGSNGALLDGIKLEYYHDQAADSLWFKITCSKITTAQSKDIGFNIMVNFQQGDPDFNFWGTDNTNPYNLLVTGWIKGTAPSTYSGTKGIADSAGVLNANYTNVKFNNMKISVDTTNATITVGMKRSDLVSNANLGKAIITAAAVGSSISWNDDIYMANGTMTLSAPASIGDPLYFGIIVYPNPAKGSFSVSGNNNIQQISVYDLSGRLVKSFSGNYECMHVSDLTPGTYVLKIQAAEGTKFQKIVFE